jgi:hypothetical protein
MPVSSHERTVYGLGAVPVPQTNVHVDPLETFRSTVNSTSASTDGTAGLNVTVDHATLAVPEDGFVAVGDGEVRVDTEPDPLPLPGAVQ